MIGCGLSCPDLSLNALTYILYIIYLFKGDDFFDIYSRVMTGEELVHIDDESEAAREEERFWKSMYFR